MRIFIICLIFLATLVASAPLSLLTGNAQEHDKKPYFIAFAWIKPDQQARYDEFLEAIKPVWARHKMQVVLRSQVVDTLIGSAQTSPPSEIAVLQVASQKDFRAYIKDPDYQALKQLRLESVDKMLVLEGHPRQIPKFEFIQSVPQFAVVVGDFSSPAPAPLLDIEISERGAIKAAIPPAFNAARSVALMALSYDDNPLAFLDNLAAESLAYVALKLD